MNPFFAEVIGTFILIVLGNGVVANVILKLTKGNGGGWIVITFGWGMAVFVAVFMMGQFSGAHINPAVTLGLALTDKFAWDLVPWYIIAQLVGAFLGAVVVYIFYKNHYDQTEDPDVIFATFATKPAISNRFSNFFSEVFGTFVLILGVLLISGPVFEDGSSDQINFGLGSLEALPVGFLVFSIGLSLGGTTGYAINPARDLGPRLAHFFLPIRTKGKSNWDYFLIPIIGPFVGAAFASYFYLFFVS